MPAEDSRTREQMIEEALAAWRPVGFQEEVLAKDIGETAWRLQRARLIEEKFIAAGDLKGVDRIRRYIRAVEGSCVRTVKLLESLQKSRRRQEKAAAPRSRGRRKTAAKPGGPPPLGFSFEYQA